MPHERLQVLQRLSCLTLLAALTCCPLAQVSAAEVGMNLSQIHLRTGYFGGSVRSQDYSDSLAVVGAMQIEYEQRLSARRSGTLQVSMGYDLSNAQMPYLGILAGMRYYLLGSNTSFESPSGADHFEIRPKWRVYAGPEAGLAYLIVRRVSPVLQVTSTAIEIGGTLGAVYQLGRDWGLEFSGAVSLGFGFANVSSSATLYRTLVGVSLYL